MAEVSQSAEFYVKTGLARALVTNNKSIESIVEILKEEKLPGTIRNSFEGLLAHERQWQREAVEMFLGLPDELRPWVLDEIHDELIAQAIEREVRNA